MNPFPKYFFAAALIVGVVTCPTIAFDLGFGSISSESELVERDEVRPGPLSELKKISAQLDTWKTREALSLKELPLETISDENSEVVVDDHKIEKVDSILYRYVMSKFIKGMASRY